MLARRLFRKNQLVANSAAATRCTATKPGRMGCGHGTRIVRRCTARASTAAAAIMRSPINAADATPMPGWPVSSNVTNSTQTGVHPIKSCSQIQRRIRAF